jgi:hypothetical protein
MAELPDDVMPGTIAEGPDGRYYLLQWNEEWRPVTKAAFLEQQKEQRRLAALEKQQEQAERAARAAALALPAPPTTGASPAELPPSPFLDTGADDRDAVIYPDDHAAVLAEAEGWHRPDGWSAERRILFLERLAELGSVRRAAAIAGVTRQAVWKLRQRAPAFRAAYEAAWRQSVELMADTAIDRAIHGTEEPVFHGGEQVGTRIRHHDRLLTYLLRVRDPLNFAPIDELDRWQRHRGDCTQAAPAGDPSLGLARPSSPLLPPPPGGGTDAAPG